MKKVRTSVVQRISSHSEVWTDILALTYFLAEQDRIGATQQESRGGVPGIWGLSYVRTYYNWINSTPSSAARMEGGIATSYYVLRSLLPIWKQDPQYPSYEVVQQLSAFFGARISADGGCGIFTIDQRGIEKIDVHLRHSCFAYLILKGLSESYQLPVEASNKLRTCANFILRQRDQEELTNEWLNESWPIGGIAAYVAARDDLFRSSYGSTSAKTVWPTVRKRMIDVLCTVKSVDIQFARARLGKTSVLGSEEHYPFWDPIKGKPILRLHSTAGCLGLVGNYISRNPAGKERISKIVASLVAGEFDGPDHYPRFDRSTLPSFAAACAILEVILAPWHEIPLEHENALHNLLTFMENSYRDPTAYHDYWTEFTAPILAVEEFRVALDFRRVITRAAEIAHSWKELELGRLDSREETLPKIISAALGSVLRPTSI